MTNSPSFYLAWAVLCAVGTAADIYNGHWWFAVPPATGALASASAAVRHAQG